MANNQQPIYQAYTVVKREGQDPYWLAIGAAFEHADKKGLNVLLQALPIDGKLVLRPPKGDAPEQEAAQSGRRRNDRRERHRP